MADRSMRLEIIIAGIERVTAPFQKAIKSTAGLGKELKAARDRMRELEAQQRDLGAYQGLEEQIVSTALELKRAKAAAAELERQFDATEKPTKRLMNQAVRAAEAVKKLEARQNAETRSLGELRAKLEAAGVSTGDLARHQDRLQRETQEANRALDQQKRKIAEVTERQQRMAKAGDLISQGGSRAGAALAVGATAGAGAATIGVGLKDVYDANAAFESRMTDIGQKADLSRAQATKLGETLRANARIANQTPEAMQDAADALAGMGLDVPIAVNLTQPLGKAATAYKASMEDLSKASFSAIDNLKVPAGQVATALDVMAFAGKKGAFELKDMAASFPSLSANYQALGQSGVGAVADLASALQIVRKGAGSSEEAATNLENVLQKIGSPETERKFAKLGVNLRNELKKAAEAGKTPIEAIAEITNKALGGDLSKLGYIFEDAQVQKGLRPLIQNLDLYRQIRAEAGKARGVVDADFAVRMQDNAEKTKALSGAVLDAKLAIGAGLSPVLTPLLTKVATAATHFAAWTKEHPKLTGFMGKTAVVVGVLFAAIAAIALVVAPILAFISALGAAAFFLGTTIGGLVATIVAVVAVVVAVVAAVIGAIRGWFILAPIVAKAWQAVVSRVSEALGFVRALGSQFIDAGKHLMGGLVQGLKDGLGSVKAAIFDAGGKVIGWFKEKLGIRSPSRVFAGLGGFVMAGLDQGLRDGQGAPLSRIVSVAGGLADRFQKGAPRLLASAALLAASGGTQLAQAAGPAGAGPGQAPRVVNITINLTAPAGVDGQAFGRAVAPEIEQAIGRALDDPRRNARYEDGYK